MQGQNCARTTDRLNLLALLSAAIGLISAVFLSGLTLGLAVAEFALEVGDNRIGLSFSGGGLDSYGDVSLRYCLISVCFMLFIVFLWVHNKGFLKVIGLIPLILIALQSWILISLKTAALPAWMKEYSSWLGAVWYVDFFVFALAVALLTLHVGSICIVYRLSTGTNP